MELVGGTENEGAKGDSERGPGNGKEELQAFERKKVERWPRV